MQLTSDPALWKGLLDLADTALEAAVALSEESTGEEARRGLGRFRVEADALVGQIGSLLATTWLPPLDRTRFRRLVGHLAAAVGQLEWVGVHRLGGRPDAGPHELEVMIDDLVVCLGLVRRAVAALPDLRAREHLAWVCRDLDPTLKTLIALGTTVRARLMRQPDRDPIETLLAREAVVRLQQAGEAVRAAARTLEQVSLVDP